MHKQQLSIRYTNTPTDSSLVCSNCDLSLNKDQSLSVIGLKTIDNNPEGNATQHTGNQCQSLTDNVYVLSINGTPLMPTNPNRAGRLLKLKKAKIINRKPFTIQLLYHCREYKQKTVLGIDAGSKNIGFSVVSSRKELLSGTLLLDQNMSKHLQEKAMYRKGRRNKLWYRPPRFLNRKRKDGWLPPSIERKYQTHLNLINRIKMIIPVERINIEVGTFDIQKINNPEIEGKGYQQGNLYQYNNIKAFLLAREQGKCQICGKDNTTDRFVVHHNIQRKDGGTDRVENLVLLHDKCHKAFHGGEKKLVVKKNKQYKDCTFMNIIKKRFSRNIEYDIRYGYETKVKREEIGIEKSHVNDGFVIAGGNGQLRNREYVIKQKRRNNRSLQLNRKGYKPSIRREKYRWQPLDEVVVEGKQYSVKGTHNKGSRIVIDDNTKKGRSVPVKNISEHYVNNGWWMITGASPA